MSEDRSDEFHRNFVVKKFNEVKTAVTNSIKQTIDEHLPYKEERMRICRLCDQYTNYDTCKVCGCYMPAKTMVKISKCPLHKW